MEQVTRRVGRPITKNKKTIHKSSQAGTKLNETRATFIVNDQLLEKIKAMAYWHRVSIKEIVHHALSDAVEKYEKWNGAIQPIPETSSASN